MPSTELIRSGRSREWLLMILVRCRLQLPCLSWLQLSVESMCDASFHAHDNAHRAARSGAWSSCAAARCLPSVTHFSLRCSVPTSWAASTATAGMWVLQWCRSKEVHWLECFERRQTNGVMQEQRRRFCVRLPRTGVGWLHAELTVRRPAVLVECDDNNNGTIDSHPH